MKGVEFLKPLKGVIVRDPMNKTPLSEKGEWKPVIGREGIYWLRRLREGSVFITENKIKNEEKFEGKKEKKSSLFSKKTTEGVDK